MESAVAMLNGERIRFPSPRSTCLKAATVKAFIGGAMRESAAGREVVSRIGRNHRLIETSLP
jgi:hypothetical protein